MRVASYFNFFDKFRSIITEKRYNYQKRANLSHLPTIKTVLKKNKFIQLGEQDFNLVLSVDALRIFNFLYMCFQFYRREVPHFDYTITLKQTTLKEELGITSNSYTTIIKKSLEELIDTKIEMRDFISEKQETTKVYQTHIIQSFKDFISPEDNKTKCFEIRFDKEFFYQLTKTKGAYTLLNLKHINTLSSIYQIRIYEYIKSYTTMKKTPKVSIEELNKLLQTDIKNLSDIEKILKRSIRIINTKTDIDITYEKNKRLKTIQFFMKTKKSYTKEDIDNSLRKILQTKTSTRNKQKVTIQAF